MIIGVPKEIKAEEYRVSLVPAGADMLTQRGHTVLVQKNAGMGAGYCDEDYSAVGAKIVEKAEDIYAIADMILKVKEPLASEYPLIREGQTLFTYLHFAASKELTLAMQDSRCVAIAYETIETADGKLPLLTPMSEVAGCMSIQQGARFLEKEHGGRGILLGGVPGVSRGTVVVFGGGVVGVNAAKVAAGMGAKVFILDVNLDRLRYLQDIMPSNVTTMMSNPYNIKKLLTKADLVIGGVLVKGGKAPKLITKDMLKDMKPGAVLVDVAIDQGGCFETSKATTHKDPIYTVEGIIHYCVANIPGAVPITSTTALTNATLPYVLELANKGWKRVAKDNPGFAKGVNMVHGHITYENVANAFDMMYTPLQDIMAQHPSECEV